MNRDQFYAKQKHYRQKTKNQEPPGEPELPTPPDAAKAQRNSPADGERETDACKQAPNPSQTRR